MVTSVPTLVHRYHFFLIHPQKNTMDWFKGTSKSETIDFDFQISKYGVFQVFSVNFPLNQSIDREFVHERPAARPPPLPGPGRWPLFRENRELGYD